MDEKMMNRTIGAEAVIRQQAERIVELEAALRAAGGVIHNFSDLHSHTFEECSLPPCREIRATLDKYKTPNVTL